MKTTKVSIEIEVPEDWVEFVLSGRELFSQQYCGYWARVLDRRDDALLVFDHEGGPSEFDDTTILQAFRMRKQYAVPRHFYVLDRAAALHAYAEGVKRYGDAWVPRKGDAITYDVVIQVALLGKVVYG